MKSFYFFSLMLLASQFGIYAQDFQGKATYFSKTTVNMDFGGRQIPEDRKKEIMERMKKANERTYILTFDKTASIYKEEERLEQPGNDRGGRRFGMMGGAAGGDYYKDVKEGRYLVKNELLGKIFLVDDQLPKLEWKLGGESKQIGNYTAFKATATKTIKRPNMRAIFRRGRDNEDNKEEEYIEKDIEVTAWYTPDVPVNQGPGEYWGLPGLILEVSDDITVVLCTKLVLNPTEKQEIKVPNKGKKVTQAEYDKISKEKMAEMRENFRRGGGGRNRGGGGGRP